MAQIFLGGNLQHKKFPPAHLEKVNVSRSRVLSHYCLIFLVMIRPPTGSPTYFNKIARSKFRLLKNSKVPVIHMKPPYKVFKRMMDDHKTMLP